MRFQSLNITFGSFALAAGLLTSCSATSGVNAVWLAETPERVDAVAEAAVEATLETGLDRDEWQPVGEPEHGEVSWYGVACNGGTHTASMETLRDHELTAAHKTLPMGTMVQVRNLDNGRSVVVRINDRGPYIRGRIIDVTPAAADELDLRHSGIADCVVQVIEPATNEVDSEPKSDKS